MTACWGHWTNGQDATSRRSRGPTGHVTREVILHAASLSAKVRQRTRMALACRAPKLSPQASVIRQNDDEPMRAVSDADVSGASAQGDGDATHVAVRRQLGQLRRDPHARLPRSPTKRIAVAATPASCRSAAAQTDSLLPGSFALPRLGEPAPPGAAFPAGDLWQLPTCQEDRALSSWRRGLLVMSERCAVVRTTHKITIPAHHDNFARQRMSYEPGRLTRNGDTAAHLEPERQITPADRTFPGGSGIGAVLRAESVRVLRPSSHPDGARCRSCGRPGVA